MPIEKIKLETVYVFLDKLKESGVTNMLGSGAYVEQEFGVSPSIARQWVMNWITTYEDRHPDV